MKTKKTLFCLMASVAGMFICSDMMAQEQASHFMEQEISRE